jgi:hypothetical protein
MQKDEIIQMHAFLIQVRSYIEDKSSNREFDAFASYKALDVAPYHIYKSIDEQKKALFELCKGISIICGK